MDENETIVSWGLDTQQAAIKAFVLIKKDGFDITKEKCSVLPIYGEEIGWIYWVLNEESKDPSKEEIVARLVQVWSDPVALC